MKISHNWLQTFFTSPLPSPAELEDLITFHSSEIEEVIKVGDDTVLDVKVLPDKSAWLMSVRGLAKEVSAITGQPLKDDPLVNNPTSVPATATNVGVSLQTTGCDYYGAARITGVKVGPSPEWLVARLQAVGQRSINNIVDATNYVMFELGQPLHAFDATKLNNDGGVNRISVRNAHVGESIVTLTGESFELTDADMLITDAVSDTPIAIAGIKGGAQAAVDANTTDIILESAHFDRFVVRHTSKRIKLRTDASARYENGISVGLAPIALQSCVKLITEIAGGNLTGYQSAGEIEINRPPVAVPLSKINSLLGLSLNGEEIEKIINKFGFAYTIDGEIITITPPWERDDLVLDQDLIEEIGRIYGMDKIVSVKPPLGVVAAYNTRHFYAEKIRHTLIDLGFSEVYTSSFRDKDIVEIQNALASDKSFLRSSLHKNIKEAVIKNVPHRDLLGLTAVKIFEIGTVFSMDGESFNVALGVQSGTSYKSKNDDPLLAEAQNAIGENLGVDINWVGTSEGVTEFSLDEILPSLPLVSSYEAVHKMPDVNYESFSVYPSVSRDVALWVPIGVDVKTVEATLSAVAGPLLVRVTLFDTFIKEEKTSLAFRLVFQSKEKTLEASEVDEQMTAVYQAATKAGWEVR